MSLTKMVNGACVPLSPEEEKEILAEWAQDDALRLGPKKLYDGQLADLLIKQGVLTQAAVDAAIATTAIP